MTSTRTTLCAALALFLLSAGCGGKSGEAPSQGGCASDAACDDGLFCNGAESCNPVLGCVSGTPPSCDDGIPCTQDTCDVGAQACAHLPLASACDDGRFCNGVESCDPTQGCTAGAPPSCDDEVSCTVDACDALADSCLNTPLDAVCDDGVFCNGTERCTPQVGSGPRTGCVAGAAVDCHDGLSCTVDACSEAQRQCTHTPIHAACDDGLACNGAETCDPAGPGPTGCVAGVPLPQQPVLFVKPPVVFAGCATPVTIFLGAAAPAVQSVTLVPSTGGAPVSLPFTVDAARPARVSATVPAGLAAGFYDVQLVHGTGCSSTSSALRVVSTVALVVTSTSPATAWTGGSTRFTVTTSSPVGGSGPVRVFLAPSTGGTAVPLEGVVLETATRVLATLPAGAAAGIYDLVLVTADGAVGVRANAATVLADPPPRITSFSPRAADPSTTGLTISGEDFRDPTVSLSCATDFSTGAVSVPAPLTGATATTASVALGGLSILGAMFPGFCDVVVTNSDGSSAIFRGYPLTSPSGSLAPPFTTAALPAPRRAPAVAAVAGPSGQFLVAAGGDEGTVGTARSTVFTSPVGPLGPTAWVAQRSALPAARTLAGAASLGRYVYVVGGADASGTPRAEVYRATLLDPVAAPRIVDVDLALASGGGLSPGVWTYRISALKAPTDGDDPSGESIGSLPVAVTVTPSFLASVTVEWGAVAGAIGYRVYRSATSWGPVNALVGEVAAPATSFVDAGRAPLTGIAPLEEGALGSWRTLPSLATPRESPAVALVFELSLSPTASLYALQGRSPGGPVSTLERLGIDVQAAGGQVPAAAWTTAASTVSPRYQHAAVTLDGDGVLALPPGQPFVTVVGGTTDGTLAAGTSATAPFTPAGTLGFTTSATSASFEFGRGAAVAAGQLWLFGTSTGGTRILTSRISAGNPPPFGAVNVGGALLTGRYLPGVARVGPAIVVVGGSPGSTSAATATTETFVW